MTKKQAKTLAVRYAAMCEANYKWLNATTDVERIKCARSREFWREQVKEIMPELAYDPRESRS